MKMNSNGMSSDFQITRYQKSDREEVFAFLPRVFSNADSKRLI
jgi:hypothetical protein